LVSDIERSSRFSTEVRGAEWLDGATGPSLDARFVGHSAHDAIGEWTTTCVVTGFEPEHDFEWSVIGGDGDVSSIWRSTITGSGDGPVHLDYSFQMGPPARRPDRRDRTDARHGGAHRRTRPEEHRQNMGRVVAGVTELAEGVTS
jgi:hypothetical protein